MTFSGGAPEKLRIGRVLSTTFSVVRANLAPFLTLGVIGLLPGLVSAGLQMANGGPSATFAPGMVAFAVSIGLIGLVFGLTLQATIIRLTYDHLANRKTEVREALMGGFRAVLPLLGLFILCMLAVMLGFSFFVIPGIMLACRWVVAGPAYVVERRGVMAAMGRSAELTKGSRWRIFGLLIILTVLFYAFEFGVLGLFGGFSAAALQAGRLHAGANLLITVLSVVLTVFTTAGATVLYSELRRRKEGAGADVVAVFE